MILLITCKYCGTELKALSKSDPNTRYHCNYCDLSFEKTDTCKDRERINPIPEVYDMNFYRTTQELLNENTVILFHTLAECRKSWYNNFTLLQQLKSLEPSDVEDYESLSKQIKSLYNEYIKLTKQKFIIENILLEKAGFVPDKLTEEFLSNLLIQSKEISEKPMYIYIKKRTKQLS
jgi:hypothetical protein